MDDERTIANDDSMTHTKLVYYAGAPYHPGTAFPANVTGECPHHHRTAAAAQRCIDRMDRAIKRGHGPHAYCDRVVMSCQVIRIATGEWRRLASTTEKETS